ncbi:hypothetical protein [Pseudarthrobacter sulfonivorans]|uniref:hypothetical protein n=1 Tax=Pseudarthrobacter sulfonivorans TaxID=121292 RepID=UPI00285F3D2F|nr:hypothetical protein [Pseudarthrobacter sulfonivorans]MDR6415653.1 hypothetical protein [Pseudarthrobacter sulfonivorans]
MTIASDMSKLLTFMESKGIDASTEVSRGWASIGAIIVDASLQRRQNYTATVKPRIDALLAAWPDAKTTSGFRKRLETGTLSEIITWPSPGRLAQIEEITRVFEDQDIETVEELRTRLTDQSTRPVFRSALAEVRHMGPKTLDYIDILSGLSTGVAIDVRIRRVARAAGIEDVSYENMSAVIRAAADSRGWRAGDLDAALWHFGIDDASPSST